MGVLRLGGGSKIYGGATWWNLTTSRFSTRGTMMNAVGTELISTSVTELWGFEFWGVRPNCEKWGTRSRTANTPFDTGWGHQQNVKIWNQTNFQILTKSTSKFSPLKFQSLYHFGKILVFRVQRCESGNQWCLTIKKGRGEWISSTMPTSDPLQFRKVGVKSSLKLVLVPTMAPPCGHTM